jgi:diguanylate cyclase (GGDEF)-like protein
MSAGEHRPLALIIDDDAVMRIALEDCLDEAGFRVAAAECGRDGLTAFQEEPAEIVMLDVQMPDMDGFAVCRALRASAAGAHVPVLMITGSDDLNSVEAAFEAGATDFTSKPINQDLLVHRVNYMLRAKRTADALREREQRLSYVQRLAQLGDFQLDIGTGEVNCSEALREFAQLEQGELGLPEYLQRVHADDRQRVANELAQAAVNGFSDLLEYRVELPAGGHLVVQQHTEVIRAADGRALSLVAAVQDITERRAAESRIRELAYHDTVTGLPNRTGLNELLDRALAAARRHARTVAVLLVDLDDFKRINDIWGHAAGDELLRAVAVRLNENLRACDVLGRDDNGSEPGAEGTVGRIGGDEFVVLLNDLVHPEDAAVVARRMNEALARPFEVRTTEVYLGGSIGISVYPDDAPDSGTLLRNADSAMYEAKAAGRNGYHFYTAAMQGRAFARLDLEARLRRAIDNQEFLLHYQPKVDLRARQTMGMEALLRWDSPGAGMISPAEFIPVAEQTGLIVPLGEWVLEESCRQAVEWQRAGVDRLCVSVNLSVAQLQNQDLPTLLDQVLCRHGLDPACLELELTESLLMHDTPGTIRLLHRFKEIGVCLAIDDFGTGYSSLMYLKQLPVDRLKVDRGFINDLEHDADDYAIVGGTIGLAHSLRLKVTAEGVETARQLEILRGFGCDEVQGFYFSRPLPAADFARWVREERQRERDANSALRLASASSQR